MNFKKLFIVGIFGFQMCGYLFAQNVSQFYLKQQIKWFQQHEQIASAIVYDTVTIYKNSKINNLENKTSLVHHKNKGLVLNQVFESEFEKLENQLNVNCLFNYQIKQEKFKKIHKLKKANLTSFNLLDNKPQNIDIQVDSFNINLKISLIFPDCFSQKHGGHVTIYYRAAREHLSEENKQSSSAKYYDWGHAYIGIKDVKTNKIYFLDGWPNESFNGNGQQFTWNQNVDKNRCDDHHSISFFVESDVMNEAITLINNIKKSQIDYKLIDFNCTDATTIVLEKLGIYTRKEHSGTTLPDSFANNLMEKLNELKICYEFDGFRVM